MEFRWTLPSDITRELLQDFKDIPIISESKLSNQRFLCLLGSLNELHAATLDVQDLKITKKKLIGGMKASEVSKTREVVIKKHFLIDYDKFLMSEKENQQLIESFKTELHKLL